MSRESVAIHLVVFKQQLLYANNDVLVHYFQEKLCSNR